MGTTAQSPKPATGVPDFSPQDLKDPTLFKLNSTIRLIWGKIANIYQSGITTPLGADLQAPSFEATDQSQPPPVGSNILLSRASADVLYSPKTQRTALVSAAYQNGTVQPITVISGGGSGGTPVSSTIIERTLTTSTTAILAPAVVPNPGDLLTIFLTQDATGGRQVTYGAAFKLVNPNDLDTRPKKVNVLQFTARTDGNWWLSSYILGRP